MFLSYLRTLILYLILIAVIRLMGKRQIGEMEASEFVVTMLVANLAAIPMQDEGIPLFSGLVPILTVLGLELILSALSLKNIHIRKLLCGKPVILIENGRILQDNLRKTRITMDELTGHLRQKDILHPETVQYAILETNGNLSVFPFPQYTPPTALDFNIKASPCSLPYTIISDGHLFWENLCRSGKNEVWLQNTLTKYGATVENTWLLSVDQPGKTHWIRKESRK